MGHFYYQVTSNFLTQIYPIIYTHMKHLIFYELFTVHKLKLDLLVSDRLERVVTECFVT